MRKQKKLFLFYFLTLVGIVSLLALIVLAPFFASRGFSMAGLIYSVFSPICHQIPSRCFILFGYPMAVCSRCLGIYLGFFIGIVLFPFVQGFSKISVPKTEVFVLVTLPIVVDTAGNFFSFWMTPGWFRLVLGAVWGFILPFFFIPGVWEAVVSRDKTKKYSKNIS